MSKIRKTIRKMVPDKLLKNICLIAIFVKPKNKSKIFATKSTENNVITNFLPFSLSFNNNIPPIRLQTGRINVMKNELIWRRKTSAGDTPNACNSVEPPIGPLSHNPSKIDELMSGKIITATIGNISAYKK